jgi:hypothetical protein
LTENTSLEILGRAEFGIGESLQISQPSPVNADRTQRSIGLFLSYLKLDLAMPSWPNGEAASARFDS